MRLGRMRRNAPARPSRTTVEPIQIAARLPRAACRCLSRCHPVRRATLRSSDVRLRAAPGRAPGVTRSGVTFAMGAGSGAGLSLGRIGVGAASRDEVLPDAAGGGVAASRDLEAAGGTAVSRGLEAAGGTAVSRGLDGSGGTAVSRGLDGAGGMAASRGLDGAGGMAASRGLAAPGGGPTASRGLEAGGGAADPAGLGRSAQTVPLSLCSKPDEPPAVGAFLCDRSEVGFGVTRDSGRDRLDFFDFRFRPPALERSDA